MKKISRKDISKMDSAELWQQTKSGIRGMARYLRPYRGRFWLGVILGVFSGIFNIVLLTGMQVVLSVVLSGQTSGLAPTTTPIFGQLDLGKMLGLQQDQQLSLPMVVAICSIIPALFFMRGMLGYLGNYCMMWVGNKMLWQLRNDLFRATLSQSLGFFNKSKVGDLVQIVFNAARIAQSNAVGLAQVLTQRPIAIISILVFLFMQYFKDWPVLLASLLILPLCVLPVIYIGRRVRKDGAREEEEAGAIMVTMHESYTGIRVVKSYAREDYEVKRFSRANSAMADNILRWSKALEIIGPVVETLASIGIALGLVYAWKQQYTAENFFVIVIALTQIYAPAKDLSRVQLMLQKCIVATSSVFSLLEEEPDIRDAPDAVVLGRAKGAVRFKDVTFHYKDPKGRKYQQAAVKRVSLELEPGKFYALVGPSGAGKSTLFSLLLRLYDCEKGAIEVDGLDLRNVTQESLRRNIGVVSQDTFLFHDTIMENIRYGRLDATDEEIIAAARKAHAHEFIMQIKDGYKAVVGDQGCNLSGGQKQRVSIARAILRNAPILLLDEAMSALDTQSEKIVQEAVHALSEGKTVIAIAHRLSTILEADQIVVMNHGQVETIGTHQELLESSDLYQRLYHLQYETDGGDPVEAAELAAVES